MVGHPKWHAQPRRGHLRGASGGLTAKRRIPWAPRPGRCSQPGSGCRLRGTGGALFKGAAHRRAGCWLGSSWTSFGTCGVCGRGEETAWPCVNRCNTAMETLSGHVSRQTFPMPEAFSEIPPPTLRRKSFCFICHRNPSRVRCWPHGVAPTASPALICCRLPGSGWDREEEKNMKPLVLRPHPLAGARFGNVGH